MTSRRDGRNVQDIVFKMLTAARFRRAERIRARLRHLGKISNDLGWPGFPPDKRKREQERESTCDGKLHYHAGLFVPKS